METKESGFEKIEKFFQNPDKSKILFKSKDVPYIDMSWVFSSLIDRDIITKTISNIMSKNNGRYQDKCNMIRKSPEDIRGFKVLYKDGNLVLQFEGADGWTKLNLVNDYFSEDKSGVQTISIEDFSNEILNTVHSNYIKEIENKISLSKEDYEKLYSIFAQKKFGDEKTSVLGIRTGLDEAFSNLVEYYEYLMNQKQSNDTLHCSIEQRGDRGSKKNKDIVKPATPRINEIIPFEKRKELLEKMNPDNQQILVNEDDPTKQYTVFMFKDCLKDINKKQNGTLFVAEPYSGDRLTRMFYLSQDEMKSFKSEEDALIAITKKYLSMSGKEFINEKRNTYNFS